MDGGIAASCIVSTICALITIYFFWRHGAFKHPVVAWILMLVSAIIPLVMCIGILPYDISLCLFGNKDQTHAGNDDSSLRVTLEVLYWISFVLTWAVNPIVVSFLRYKETISLKHRIWLTIRENLIVYGIIVGAVVVGVIWLMATGRLTFANLGPLAIGLANGYGLLVLCFCLGHGFVAMPRTLWLMATPSNSYLYHLHKIAQETSMCSEVICDAEAVVIAARRAKEDLRGELKNKWDEVGQERADTIVRLKGEILIPEEFYVGFARSKKVKSFGDFQWKYCSTSKLEDFFAIMDDIIDKLRESKNILEYSSSRSYAALLQLKNKNVGMMKMIGKRALAVLLVIINVICMWGELVLMFKKDLSIFYIISHVSMSKIVAMCITTLILAYLVFVGSWSLTHLRLGSFFKFTKGATNANTLNYFAIILCRLGPTIGFHYLQQINAPDSQFQKVMGVMDVIVFIGTKWNIYAPILLILLILFFAFNMPDRIMACFGKDTFSFDYSVMSYSDLASGEKVLKRLNSDAANIISQGYSYVTVVDEQTKDSKQSTINEPLIHQKY